MTFRVADGTDIFDYYTLRGETGAMLGSNTGFSVSFTDIRFYLLPYATGTKRPASGFKTANGTDLSDLFQNSAVPVFAVTWAGTSYGAIVLDPADAFVTVNFNANATMTLTNNNGSISGSWGTPTTAGVGNAYWIRGDHISGTAPSSGSTLGVWHQLNTPRGWSLVRTLLGEITCTIQVLIAADSGGSTILASGNLVMTATVDF